VAANKYAERIQICYSLSRISLLIVIRFIAVVVAVVFSIIQICSRFASIISILFCHFAFSLLFFSFTCLVSLFLTPLLRYTHIQMRFALFDIASSIHMSSLVVCGGEKATSSVRILYRIYSINCLTNDKRYDGFALWVLFEIIQCK
jgi:hypothetical protein